MEQQKKNLRAIYDLYVERQDDSLLDEAVLMSRMALAETPITDPIDEFRADITNNLSIFLYIKNEKTWTIEAEEEALSLMEQIGQATPRGQPGRERTMLNLAGRYKAR